MKISERAKAVPPSETLAITAKAKQLRAQGIDVVSFGAGEPDFDTPEFIEEAAIKAMKAGKTKYTAAAGTPEVRSAIAGKLKRENGLDYAPNQVIVTIGGKHSVYEAMQAVLDKGDEVILPVPYWVTYPEAIKLAGGKIKFVAGVAKNNYKITPGQLKKAITKKTTMFVLNSPNNPGGFTYTPEEQAELSKVLEGTDVIVMSDEMYEKLVYGGTKFVSFAAISKDAYDRTLTLNGFSKAFSMTGWRMGYTAGPAEIIAAMDRLQSHMTSNAVTFIQDAAVEALNNPAAPQTIENMRIEFEKRARYMADRLNGIEGITCPEPTGAFYCFPDVSAHFGRNINGAQINGSNDFTTALLGQSHVAVVPGLPFGCNKNIRLSFACSLEQIKKGLDRIEQWLKR